MIWTAGGVASAALGVIDPGRIHAQLPQLSIDAEAVGGAAVALGASVMVLGIGHLLAAAGTRRRAPWSRPAAVVLAATMSALLLASASAAFVSLATGIAPAAALTVAGVGAGVWALAYAWVAAVLIGQSPGEAG